MGDVRLLTDWLFIQVYIISTLNNAYF